MDKSKVIFGNVQPGSVYKKAVKSKAKYARKFGDDSDRNYSARVVDNEYIGDILGVKNIAVGDSDPGVSEGFDEERGIIVGNIRMGFGHYRISMARYKMKFDDAYRLFGKYIGNWGGEVTRFRFEGIKDGEVVKTVIKSSMTKLCLELDVSSSELTEDSTYDVASVRIKVTDEYGNVMSFYNRQALLDAEGDIEVLGPSLADINGGMGGFYVRSIGKEGKGKVSITLTDTGLASEVGFTVSKK